MNTQLDPERAGAPARILKAALALFTQRGYHGTSVRTIASVVGLEAASLYHHFPSKQRILFEIFEHTMNDLLVGMERALASAETIDGKLRALLRFHVLFHIERQQEAFLSHSELRSLTPSNGQRVLAKRDRYERRLRDLLAAGVAAGLFQVRDVQLATIAILMMWSGVSDWFVGGKRLTPDAVVETYCDMTLALLRRSGDRGPALADSSRELPGSGARHDTPRDSRPQRN